MRSHQTFWILTIQNLDDYIGAFQAGLKQSIREASRSISSPLVPEENLVPTFPLSKTMWISTRVWRRQQWLPEGRSCCRVCWTWPRWSRTSTLPADGMWAIVHRRGGRRDVQRWRQMILSAVLRNQKSNCRRGCSSWSLCRRCWGWVEVEWTQESGGVAGLYWQNVDYLKNKLQAALYMAVLGSMGCPSLLSVHVDLMRFIKVSHGGYEEGLKCEPHLLSNVCISSDSCSAVSIHT